MIGLLLMTDLDEVVITDCYRSSFSTRVSAYGWGLSAGQSKGTRS